MVATTRLGVSGIPRQPYGDFTGKTGGDTIIDVVDEETGTALPFRKRGKPRYVDLQPKEKKTDRREPERKRRKPREAPKPLREEAKPEPPKEPAQIVSLAPPLAAGAFLQPMEAPGPAPEPEDTNEDAIAALLLGGV